ncbi:MAG TPA: ABC transporter substrate-binding protein [Candidatus Eisenbacteria bacterium]|nr:ABC transporter substrate-binding protein [Candidatus Eisenbacteria bacterium]
MRSMHRSLAPVALGLGLFALAGMFPFVANAQRTPTPYRVGVLNDARGANHLAVDGLKAGLRDLGFEEGRDVIFDDRLTDGDPERITPAAAALVKAGVNVIFTSGEAATLAARAATPAIPIVFTLVGDPVAAGVVKSLAQPAGNVTGISSLATELVPKRLEALKALAPQVRRAWAIQHAADPASGAALARALAFASRFGMEIVPRIVRTPADLDEIVEGLRPGDALLVPDIATMDISAMLLEASLARRVPAVFSSALWVSHGGLVSYGADYRAQGVQAARLVAKILRGARPRDLPVEGADRIILAVNLKTAASLGLTAPRQVLFRADIIRR